jgi:ankyrin repeat protein
MLLIDAFGILNRIGLLARPAGLRWFMLALTIFCPRLIWAQAMPPAERDCDTPLIAAIHNRDVSKFRKLVDTAVDLNAKACGEGETALGESIALNMPEITKDLILAGANPNTADNKGATPLIYAALYCAEDVVVLLLQHGVAVNAVDSDGYSSLMHAAYMCTGGRIVALLLRAGARVNLTNKDGGTALTSAIAHHGEYAVQELVAAGADLTTKNGRGETALTIARDTEPSRHESNGTNKRIYKFLLAASQLRTGQVAGP